jgi:hypothetical protein
VRTTSSVIFFMAGSAEYFQRDGMINDGTGV